MRTLRDQEVATVENVRAVARKEACAEELSEKALTEWVADKGYHSNATMETVDAVGLRSYISEPQRGQRRWRDRESARNGAYSNRRRIKTKRGRALMRRRGELLERTFAHCLETGGMRRVYLRGRDNFLERYWVPVAAFNLSLVMRRLVGAGTPRGLAARLAALFDACGSGLVSVVVRIVITARYMADATLNHVQLRSQRSELAAVTSSTGG